MRSLRALACQRWPRIGTGSCATVARLTKIVSTAILSPPKSGRPLATTSILRPSVAVTSRLRAVATLALASLQMRSRVCARAVVLMAPASAADASRNSSLGTSKSGPVGRTVSAQPAPARPHAHWVVC